MSIQEVTNLPSIQGERETSLPDPVASDWDIDEFVDGHSEGVNQCRAERRHPFPIGGTQTFTDIDNEGNFIRIVTCPRCDCAYKREVWGTVRRGQSFRYELLDSYTSYRKNRDGETYLMPPGMGRARPVQFRESLMTLAMKGQSPAAMRKQLANAKKSNVQRGNDE